MTHDDFGIPDFEDDLSPSEIVTVSITVDRFTRNKTIPESELDAWNDGKGEPADFARYRPFMDEIVGPQRDVVWGCVLNEIGNRRAVFVADTMSAR
jgi:hypothetical protein